jgi:hypothetical protein
LLADLVRRKIATSRVRRDELAFESMVFSLSTEVPRPTERRADERILAILPLAKFKERGGEWQMLCRIRNISAGGLMAEAANTNLPAVGTELEIELNSNRVLRGRAVWVRDAMMGVKFDENVNLRELLANRTPRGAYQARPPRLEVTCGATVRIGKLFHKVEVQDISLGGIKVRLSDWKCVGEPVVVTLDSFRPIKGVVRWYRAGFAGIVFDRPLGFNELAEWLGKRVEIASVKTGAWDLTRR